MMEKLKIFIQEEEFETDSIFMDIEQDIGNIATKMSNQTMITFLKQFITMHQSMFVLCPLLVIHIFVFLFTNMILVNASSFRIGFKFYYVSY